jgi:RNA methyltransferase, TrmH family
MTSPATSARDPRVVRAARLLRDEAYRREERAFVVDSAALLEAALAAGLRPTDVFVADGDAGRAAAAPAGSVVEASGDAMRALSAVGEVPGVVGVFAVPPAPEDLPPSSLVLAGVADAGNVGSLIRTARAFGLPRVALTPETADPWSRRALRASLGAAFVPGLVGARRPLEALAALDSRPPLAAAVPRGGMAPEALPPGAAVVLGSERDGLTPGERALCDVEVTIPAGGFESLNVGAAGAILAYAIARRRSPGDGPTA